MKEEIIDSLHQLAKLLEDKEQMMQSILSLTREQGSLFSSDHMDKLQALIDCKQQYIEKIKVLDAAINAHYDCIHKACGGLDGVNEAGTEDTRACIKVHIEQIKESTVSIHQLEIEHMKRAVEMIDEIQYNLQEVEREKKAVNTYNPLPVNTETSRLDIKK